MKTTIEQRHTDRRGEILAVCAKLFASKGFSATSVRDICAALEMSPGTLYRYYASKEEIVGALIAYDLKRAKEAVQRVPKDADLISALSFIAEMVLNDPLNVENPNLWLDVSAEASRNREVGAMMQNIYAGHTALFLPLIEAAKEKGQISASVNSNTAVTFIFAAFDGLLLRRAIDPSVTLGDTSEAFLQLIGNALGFKAPKSTNTKEAR